MQRKKASNGDETLFLQFRDIGCAENYITVNILLRALLFALGFFFYFYF